MHSYLKSALVAVSLLAASAYGAAAFEAETVEPIELREGPAWGFAAIVELPPGAIVEVLNCSRIWCEVAIEDYEGYVPRGSLDLGGYSPPLYAFPPLISQPSLWHGRYFSRDHYRYESRFRWRNREGRRLFNMPERVQPRPLPAPLIRRGPGTPTQPGIVPDRQPLRRDGLPREKQVAPKDAPRERERVVPQNRKVEPQPRIQQQPRPEPRAIQPQPRPQIQQQAPAQRQAPPPQPQPQKKKQDQKG